MRWFSSWPIITDVFLSSFWMWWTFWKWLTGFISSYLLVELTGGSILLDVLQPPSLCSSCLCLCWSFYCLTKSYDESSLFGGLWWIKSSAIFYNRGIFFLIRETSLFVSIESLKVHIYQLMYRNIIFCWIKMKF